MALDSIRNKLYFRIDITAQDGTVIRLTQDDIIRCVLSLRSDLSPIDPTIPESEIEFDFMNKDYPMERFTDLPDETPITYQWGKTRYYYYAARYFYIDEVSSSEDNVIHIHAVDQVHKLDRELPPIYVGQRWVGKNVLNQSYGLGIHYLRDLFYDVIDGQAKDQHGNIEHLSYFGYNDQCEGTSDSRDQVESIIERGTRREIAAKLMNLCRFEFDDNFLSGTTQIFWPSYVDAGRPEIQWTKSRRVYSNRPIYEEDCGEIKQYRGENVSKYNLKTYSVFPTGLHGMGDEIEGATGTATKQNSLTMEYNGFANIAFFGKYLKSNNLVGFFPLWRMNDEQSYYGRSRPYLDTFSFNDALSIQRYGYWLLDGDLSNNEFNFLDSFAFHDLSGSHWTESFYWEYPNTITPSEAWNDWINAGDISNEDTTATVDGFGMYYALSNEHIISVKKSNKGVEYTPEKSFWNGHINAVSYYDNTKTIELLPGLAAKNMKKWPLDSGSFVWRWDYDWQPREYFDFYFLERNLLSGSGDQLTDENGNELITGGFERRTIETITITHEGGGTISEITYRKGEI